jgi:hypothetical protein
MGAPEGCLTRVRSSLTFVNIKHGKEKHSSLFCLIVKKKKKVLCDSLRMSRKYLVKKVKSLKIFASGKLDVERVIS